MEQDSCIEITAVDRVAVVGFKVEWLTDVEDLNGAAERVREFVKQQRPRRVVFDFSGVKFFSSQVLGLLLAARAQVQEIGGDLVICSVEPQLYRIFKVTHLDRVFKFFPDREIAVRINRQNSNCA